MHELRIVTQRFALFAFLVAAVLAAGLSGGRAASAPTAGEVWTVVIPEGFPQDIFTWRLKSDGTYEEDGREAASGQAIQPTYTGTWTVDAGGHMVLRQNEIAYIFDGVRIGDRYTGTLTLAGRRVSRFCAAKGATAPDPKACKNDEVGA
jgi:hypothetical protein